MAHARFRVLRTKAGGISLGWSAYKLYRECPRKFWWSYLARGDGVEAASSGPSEAMLYGSLWHATYRGRLLGRPDHESMAQVFADDGITDPEPWTQLVEQVVGDMDWYEQQPSEYVMKVLACEQEQAVAVPCAAHMSEAVADCPNCGRHEMRGTIDLVGQLDGSWGSRVCVIDHKTTDKPNHPTAWTRYRESRQLTYYLALWSLARPDLATCDGLVNVVQSFAGKRRAPAMQRIWAFRAQHQLDRITRDFTSACDEIEAKLAAGGEEGFAENPDACVVYRPCQFLELCAASKDEQEAMMDAQYRARFEFPDMVKVVADEEEAGTKNL